MAALQTLILAAGKGTRLKSDIPKVLHEICGWPLIRYVLEAAGPLGSSKTTVVLGHQAERVRKALPDGTETVIQKKLLGTADAVKTARSSLRGYQGDVLILCGDTPLLRKESLKHLVNHHQKSGAVCTFLTAVVHDNKGYGRILRTQDGRPAAIREEKDASEIERQIAEINVGVYCFQAPVLLKALNRIALNKKKKEFYLTDLIELFAEDGQPVETVETLDAHEGWGVNDRADLARCSAVIRERLLRAYMLQGVTVEDPSVTYIEQDVRIGRDTVIRPFTFIEKNVRIGSGCQIGPFCHLRPGTRISAEAQIGNFTEVSRSEVGAGSMMKHFGFLGDARLGRRVNIGAGTVTANYDGQKKNPTVIADQAFIGSDSVLVAPVKVGKGAMTAAGSVVTPGTRVPDGGLVMGVPARHVQKKDRKKSKGDQA